MILDDKLSIHCFLKRLGLEKPAGIERQTNQTPSGKNLSLIIVSYLFLCFH